MRKRLLSAAIFSLFFVAWQVPATAAPLTPDSVVDGKTIAEWSGEWWRWAANPLNEDTGALAYLGNIPGPVFFIGGSNDISFAVPSGKNLFFPLITSVFVVEPAFGDTLADAQDFVNTNYQDMINLHAVLDGVPIPNLSAYGVFSPLFSVDIPADGWAGFDEGHFSQVLASGYWLMLEPLSAGQHTLTYGGALPGFEIETRATITVTPEPGSLSMMLLALGSLLVLVILLRRVQGSVQKWRSFVS